MMNVILKAVLATKNHITISMLMYANQERVQINAIKLKFRIHNTRIREQLNSSRDIWDKEKERKFKEES